MIQRIIINEYVATSPWARTWSRWCLPITQGSKLPANVKRMKAKECFSNASKLADGDARLTYVEGLACSAKLPLAIHHAWCVAPDGAVIDPTWTDPEETLYLGIPVATNLLNRTLLQQGHYGLLNPPNPRFIKLYERINRTLGD